jgi:hypothetical protein
MPSDFPMCSYRRRFQGWGILAGTKGHHCWQANTACKFNELNIQTPFCCRVFQKMRREQIVVGERDEETVDGVSFFRQKQKKKGAASFVRMHFVRTLSELCPNVLCPSAPRTNALCPNALCPNVCTLSEFTLPKHCPNFV